MENAAAVASIAQNGRVGDGKAAHRSYRCDPCHLIHLTSREQILFPWADCRPAHGIAWPASWRPERDQVPIGRLESRVILGAVRPPVDRTSPGGPSPRSPGRSRTATAQMLAKRIRTERCAFSDSRGSALRTLGTSGQIRQIRTHSAAVQLVRGEMA